MVTKLPKLPPASLVVPSEVPAGRREVDGKQWVFLNEGATYRVKVPVGEFTSKYSRLVKWMFTAVIVTPDGKEAVKNLMYSPDQKFAANVAGNGFSNDILFFSNPDAKSSRLQNSMEASLDQRDNKSFENRGGLSHADAYRSSNLNRLPLSTTGFLFKERKDLFFQEIKEPEWSNIFFIK